MYARSELGLLCTSSGSSFQPNNVGIPAPMVEIKIIHQVSGRALGPGESGDICVRGPHLMLGYLDDPVATGLLSL